MKMIIMINLNIFSMTDSPLELLEVMEVDDTCRL